MVDKDLKGNFDLIELEEMVQVALLCTQFNPSHRPKMSEVLKMLEGDGLAERWEASQRIETPRFRSCEPQRYSDLIEESSLVVEAMELSGPRWQTSILVFHYSSLFKRCSLHVKNDSVISVNSYVMLVFICKKKKKKEESHV